ncbi:MAG: N-acetyl-gamma-glutamyl-phosphate reductase [Candidatus Gracilibacteria bacterium]
MNKKITVSIIGATGYTGLELIRILNAHPYFEVKYLSSGSTAGKKISEVWPHLKGICDLELTNMDPKKIAEDSDCVFLALPNLESQKIAGELIGLSKIIDLSPDFRVKNIPLYEQYHHTKHLFPQCVKEFTYGVPELNKKEIIGASHIANPGCFAISVELALAPLKKRIKHVDVFSITGSSGSGKSLGEGTHHPVRNHNVKSYKIGVHQHIPEIIQTLGLEEGQLSFVPTSGPFVRGIQTTAFIELKKNMSASDALETYKKVYAACPFIRIKKEVQIAEVVGSNFCDISIVELNGKLIIQSVIDNLVKGASGTAIQNCNLMFGLPETEGLLSLSPLFP